MSLALDLADTGSATTLPDVLDFDKDRDASPRRMNAAMTYLYLRLAAATALQPEFATAIAQLQGVGLERLNEVLGPILADAQGIAEQLAGIRAAWLTGDPLQGLLDGLADDVTARLVANQAAIDAAIAPVAASLAQSATAVAAANAAVAALPSRAQLAIIFGSIV